MTKKTRLHARRIFSQDSFAMHTARQRGLCGDETFALRRAEAWCSGAPPFSIAIATCLRCYVWVAGSADGGAACSAATAELYRKLAARSRPRQLVAVMNFQPPASGIVSLHQTGVSVFLSLVPFLESRGAGDLVRIVKYLSGAHLAPFNPHARGPQEEQRLGVLMHPRS